MALFKTVLIHVLLLAAAHLVFTQSTSEEPPQTPTQPPPSPPQGGQGPPQGGQRPPQGGQRPPQGGQGPPQGGQRPPQGGQGPPQGGQGPPGGLGIPPITPLPFGRKRREVAEQEQDPQVINPQSKFLGFTTTKCNYTREAGSRCTSCTKALTCLPNNVGLARQCWGLFRHCNNGRCSLFQSEACAAAATTAANVAATTAADVAATTAAGVTAAATEASTAG